MPKTDTFQENELLDLIGKLNLLDNLCDQVRLVDPVRKRVLRYQSGAVSESDGHCFDYWENGVPCDNCISMRTFRDGKTYVKIEYTGDKTFMVTTLPLSLQDRRVVVEIMKDMTGSLSFGTGAQEEQSEVHEMIDFMNRQNARDALTGVFNRRYIDERLPAELAAAALMQRGLSLVMADIDHFKRVNDTYGHVAGDEVLKAFSKTLAGCLRRKEDWVARYGGEEFLVCLPFADNPAAADIAEQLRGAVEAMSVPFGDAEIRITSSFGVFTVAPDSIESIEALIAHTDKLLYRAKQTGRNRVVAG